jgi:putative radical SAM enzyme (TIGR03279 family)
MPHQGIKILEVVKDSAAEKAGLNAGDRILEADGHDITDELALRFYLADENVDLLVRRTDGDLEHLTIDLSELGTPGIHVEEFKTRLCNNECLFCFVDQLPAGVRPTLRVKDDDYRLSFLHGNYITLTNLTNRDIARIVEQRLSPLYVSVHATETDLRTRILGRKKTDDLIGKIKRLVNNRIRLHAQIVLMPGINDGGHLETTIEELHRFYPGVQSIAVVPVGLSDYGLPRKRLKPATPGYCRKTARQVACYQKRFRKRDGESFVYLADEFYIQGDIPLPSAEHYDDFAQIEDGVGMVRAFLDEFELHWKRRRKSCSTLRGTLVTGKLFEPFLRNSIDRFNRKFGAQLKVHYASNNFLGKNITVAGLLSGQDILEALRRKKIGDFVIIPQDALSATDEILLDNLSLQDLSDSLGKPVYSSGHTVRDFFELLFKIQSKVQSQKLER